MADDPASAPPPDLRPAEGGQSPAGPSAEPAERRPSEPPPEGSGGAARSNLLELREPLYWDAGGYRLRLDPSDLARLRELPGSKGRTDRELGEQFFEGQAGRLAAALLEDVPAPAEVRVVVDPFSRQAFLALENKIRAILSF